MIESRQLERPSVGKTPGRLVESSPEPLRSLLNDVAGTAQAGSIYVAGETECLVEAFDRPTKKSLEASLEPISSMR
jgi:hypothetical protein